MLGGKYMQATEPNQNDNRNFKWGKVYHGDLSSVAKNFNEKKK